MMGQIRRSMRITLISVLASATLVGAGFVFHSDYSYTKRAAAAPAAPQLNTNASITRIPGNPGQVSTQNVQAAADKTSESMNGSASTSLPVDQDATSEKTAAVTTAQGPVPSGAAADDPVPNEKNVNLDQTQINQVKTQLESPGNTANEPGWQRKSDAIIAVGMKYLGTPYVFGAKTGQTATFDCSSFMKYIFGTQGIKLPRDSRQQSLAGTDVGLDQLRPGDLLFFTTPARKSLTGVNHIGHVGIYIGNGLILHTFRPGVGVTMSKLQGPWLKRFVEAKRVVT